MMAGGGQEQQTQLRVELVRLYKFSLNGRVLCIHPALSSWFQIQQDVLTTLQRQGMSEALAKRVWERLRGSE